MPLPPLKQNGGECSIYGTSCLILVRLRMTSARQHMEKQQPTSADVCGTPQTCEQIPDNPSVQPKGCGESVDQGPTLKYYRIKKLDWF